MIQVPFYPEDPHLTNEMYVPKFEIAERLKPRSIIEIGVRCGYSAWCFLKASPGARYVGIDADNGTHGGQRGPWMWRAPKLLRELTDDFMLIQSDMADLKRIYMGIPFDMGHVDGDHTYAAAINDISLLMTMCQVVVVDDTESTDDVKRAVEHIMEKPTNAVGDKLYFTCEWDKRGQGQAVITNTPESCFPSRRL